MYKYIDDNGVTWIWDTRGERIYSVEAEIVSLKEVLNGKDHDRNGYFASNKQNAAKMMIDGGYTEKKLSEVIKEFESI
ncbi:MAG: hypothetical protein WC677_07710 [Clostridia bacterium]|jgi:hypothetical protein